jgi:fructose/tagatose bisphosphate aldolase
MGHEAGPLPPYDELFESGRGFTDTAEAKRFVHQTNVDWLSVAIGSIHGAVSAARKSEKKVEARLDINRLDEIRRAVGIPLVLHGGTGIRKESILKSIQHGIAKVNVATAIRQPYEKAVRESLAAGQEAVYRATLATILEDLEIGNSAARLAQGTL